MVDRPLDEAGLVERARRGDLDAWATLVRTHQGIAFRTVEVVDALGGPAAGGILSVDGGLTRSRYFLEFFSTVAGRSIGVPANDELTAFGAAMLAARGRISVDQQAKQIVEPGRNGDVAAWREKFSAARERSSGWRESRS